MAVSSVVRMMSTARGIVLAAEGQRICLCPSVLLDHISAIANLLGDSGTSNFSVDVRSVCPRKLHSVFSQPLHCSACD